MDVTVENTSEVRRKIRLTVPAGDVTKAYKQIVRKIGGRVRIKGFRPGKAPRKLIERRYGPIIREEVLERLLGKAIPSALDDSGVEALSQPELDEVGELRDGEDLAVAFSVEVLPALELSNWAGMALEVPLCAADEEDLSKELDELASTHAEVVDVEGAAVEGDQVALTCKLPGDDSDEPSVRRFVVGGEGQPEWVAAALDGAEVGKKFEVPEYVRVGDEDGRPEPEMITGTIDTVKRRMLPDQDDALAKKDGRKDTWAELVEDLKTEQARRAERRQEAWRRDAVLDHVVAHNPFEVPRALVDREVDHRIARTFGPQALQPGGQLAQFLDQLRDSMRDEAVGNVRRALVIHHVIDEQKVEVSDEDVDARIDRMQEEFTDLPEKVRIQMRTDDGKAQTRDTLTQERVLDWLLSQVTIVDGDTLHLRDEAPTGHKHAHDGHDHDGSSAGDAGLRTDSLRSPQGEQQASGDPAENTAENSERSDPDNTDPEKTEQSEKTEDSDASTDPA